MTAATLGEATESDNVFTILRVPMTDAAGKYYRRAKVMMIADDLSHERARQAVRNLLTGQCPKQSETHQPAS